MYHHQKILLILMLKEENQLIKNLFLELQQEGKFFMFFSIYIIFNFINYFKVLILTIT